MREEPKRMLSISFSVEPDSRRGHMIFIPDRERIEYNTKPNMSFSEGISTMFGHLVGHITV